MTEEPTWETAETELQPNGYDLQGTLLEICSCHSPCPCFIGEDPDGGKCDGVLAFKLAQGQVGDQDVSGLTVVNIAQIPGNALAGGWRSVLVIDDGATEAQHEALLQAFSGQLGGPLADMAGLVGEVVAVERAPITHSTDQVKGGLQVGGIVDAEVRPIQSAPDGSTATLYGSAFATVEGAPAYLGKSTKYRVDLRQHGMTWSFDGHNATQTAWHMEHRP